MMKSVTIISVNKSNNIKKRYLYLIFIFFFYIPNQIYVKI